ncbi:transglutaminase-like domain-containing protein [Pelagicoccus enzymogenes]|uniref:transglutaminase-like domain-containing protein n=1 Tax=Pelagicoccus enzymogenes TaxID=2773457 RepID=UPI0028105CB5|nr:transglutaminase-like domain-containing protein [Pelagicoccus enzymogenes]MDQ8197241.1 transglutaminase-like domain-containing protein [Pelagicoccus enzymogenes]
MKRKSPKFPWIFLTVILWTVATLTQERLSERGYQPPPEPFRIIEPDTIPPDELELSLAAYDSGEIEDRPFLLPADALAVSLSSRTRIRERQIKNRPADSAEIKHDKGYLFVDSNKQTFAASKLGLDFKHHFKNSFLVGYKPFDVSEIWMPHEVLTMRLKYQLDKDNFAGFQEIWLSSYEAFKRGRGDCEDHAIALADWLIEMGEDARVVTGTHNGGGHAWVVVLREAGTFLLESTSKKRRRLFSSYPLAKLATGYAPEAMFNREYYWINKEPDETSSYTGKHWFKNGRITR